MLLSLLAAARRSSRSSSSSSSSSSSRTLPDCKSKPNSTRIKATTKAVQHKSLFPPFSFCIRLPPWTRWGCPPPSGVGEGTARTQSKSRVPHTDHKSTDIIRSEDILEHVSFYRASKSNRRTTERSHTYRDKLHFKERQLVPQGVLAFSGIAFAPIKELPEGSDCKRRAFELK